MIAGVLDVLEGTKDVVELALLGLFAWWVLRRD